jgi:hemerythrin-like domain-containing protein
MSETLKIIRAEHRRLAAVINCFVGVLQEIKDRGHPPEYEMFEQVVVYFEQFLYRFHHPKEDEYLFPRLLQRVAESAEVIERLESEHKEGKEILLKLRTNLDNYRRQQDETSFESFYNIAMVYRDFEWHHMGTEEREVLPLAEKSLSESDWAELDGIFTAHEDPVFGRKQKDEFSDLATRIVNLAPAPHGLGG